MRKNIPFYLLMFIILPFIYSCGTIRINYHPSDKDITTYQEYREMKAREFRLKYPNTDFGEEEDEVTFVEQEREPVWQNNIVNDDATITPCPYNIYYICGCDGRTYSNPCLAYRSGIYYYTIGRCEDKE